MDKNDGEQGPRAQVDKGSIPAKDRGITKLEERPEQGRQGRGVGMGEAKLIEVVHMRDAKVQRRDEDDPAGRDMRQKMQRDNSRAEHNLLGDGALNAALVFDICPRSRKKKFRTYRDIISPADPAA